MAKVRIKISEHKEIELDSDRRDIDSLIVKAVELASKLQKDDYKPSTS